MMNNNPLSGEVEATLDTILDELQYQCWKDGADGESMHHVDYDLQKAKSKLTKLLLEQRIELEQELDFYRDLEVEVGGLQIRKVPARLIWQRRQAQLKEYEDA